jgi:hypothetical protein
MIIHFSSVHTFILTLPIEVAENEIAKLLRNLKLSINNNPYQMRPDEAAIRTAGSFGNWYDGGRIDDQA